MKKQIFTPLGAGTSPLSEKALLSVLVAALMLSGCAGSPDLQLQEPSAPLQTAPDTTAAPYIPEMVTLEPGEIYSQDGITVTVTGLEDGFLGPEIQLQTANDTQQNLVITAWQISVNGCMMESASFYSQVAPGKKALDAISFYQSDLTRAGIRTIGQVEFYLRISHGDTYDTLTETPLLTISTSAGDIIQEKKDAGQELYLHNGIRIVNQGLRQDLLWDGTLVLYLENTSQEPVTVYSENVSVNGVMTDDAMWCDLRPGTWAIDGMTLMNLGSSGITDLSQLETMEFTLRIVHAYTWEELDRTEPITLAFP